MLKIRGESDFTFTYSPEPGSFNNFDGATIPNDFMHDCVYKRSTTWTEPEIPEEEFLSLFFTDFTLLKIEPFAKAEIWLDYGYGNIKWPNSWKWISDVVPTGSALVPKTRYFIEVLNDGENTIAKVVYSYKLNG